MHDVQTRLGPIHDRTLYLGKYLYIELGVVVFAWVQMHGPQLVLQQKTLNTYRVPTYRAYTLKE